MSALTSATSSDFGIKTAIAVARPAFQAAIWEWAMANQDRVVFKKWFMTIRLRDVFWIVDEIAGPRPTTTPLPEARP